MGNKKPPLLLRVEKELFLSLFRLATQNTCILTEMRDCINRMPWGDLNKISEESASWFKPAGGDVSLPASLHIAGPGSKTPLEASGGNLVAGSFAPSPHARPEESSSSGSAGPRFGAGVGSVEQDASAGGPQSQATSLGREDDEMEVDDGTAAHRLRPQKPLPLPRPEGQSSLGRGGEEMEVDEENQESSHKRPSGLRILGPRGGQPPLGRGEGAMEVDEENQGSSHRQPLATQLPAPNATRKHGRSEKSLGKRKEGNVGSLKKISRGKEANRQPLSVALQSSGSFDSPIDVDELFVSIKTLSVPACL